MHIPDGYLGPQTALPAIAGMVPIWAVALNKVKKTLSAKRIPALALCAAFAFVIMMFNIPIWGSSAHAVGAVFIAILLGPWAAVISLSTTLFIQAFVFRDGGTLAFGINCLNMAFIMPFTGFGVYKLIAGKSKLGSSRNLVGSFIGGYVGINLAALCASVEFGIQPLLFKAADGASLYCPYPLSVSVPSMMFAHLLVAGPVEGVITAAGIAYVAKFAPQLFARELVPTLAAQPEVSFIKRYKMLLIPLGVLIVLSPLGLIATGTAWGEYSTEEIKSMVGYIPKGMAAMADKWNALFPDYSLPALGNGAAGSVGGYILSAVVGMVLIVGLILLTSTLITKAQKGKTAGGEPEKPKQ